MSDIVDIAQGKADLLARVESGEVTLTCALPYCDRPAVVTIDFGTTAPGLHHRCAQCAAHIIVTLRRSLDEAELANTVIMNRMATAEYDRDRAEDRARMAEAGSEDMRQLWNKSRHYKRLRQYRQRLSAAEERAEAAEAKLKGI